ncbi:MAG: tRNA dihydrouridine synthase DusB [Bacteroidales bacterium]|jgi:tRNA-dihydrouridine synthase B|nr:tRNA dihydrouridine synthase DusB [Bacteroidales bacterium]
MDLVDEIPSLYHPVTIGNVTIGGNIFLAPLAGYTDRAFRSVCISQGASFTYTEMVSAEGVARGSDNTESLMIRDTRESQLGIQIFMPEASVALRALPRLLHYNPTIIDINCGCPVPKVIKTGAGSALMNDPDKIHNMIKNLKEFTDIPISIKIRTGWDDSSINYKDVASAALSAKVDMITMHARTRKMAYSGIADWNTLKELKQYVSYRNPKVVVFGSGDLFSPMDAKKMLKTTGIDGLMFARGAVGDPFIFNNTIRLLQNNKIIEPTLEEKLTLLLTQLHTMGEYTGESNACREMRKHATSYIKGMAHGAKAKQALVQSTTYKEYEHVCDELIKGNL